MKDLRLLTAFAVAALAACKVGPKYTQPSVPMAPTYKEQPPVSFKEAGKWKVSQPRADAFRGRWWEIFGDSQLNALEQRVTAGNQDLKTAEARFREARTVVRYNRAAEFPTISVAPNIRDLRLSPNQPYFTNATGTNSRLGFLLPFDLSWELDVWGRIRRTVAAAGEEAQASAADLAAIALSLHAELAMDYFELRAADAQKQLLDQTVRAYTEMVQLTASLLNGGAAPEQDVTQAKTQLEGAQVQAADIGVYRSQFEHAIAILTGQPPARFSLPFSPLNLEPPVIPAGVPSELLERRPDIAATERRVAEANEGIGIARAAYFPTITLSASGGFESTRIGNWLTWPSRFWAIGPTAMEIIFDAGRRRAASDAAQANYDATVATYRQATLTAFQQVEDNLAALRILEQEAAHQKQAVAEARRGLLLFAQRYEHGVDPYLQVVTGQIIVLANQQNEVAILQRRMDASVLLIKALGGGWDVSKLPPVSSMH
jgi:NodT family efflux transporter outer membrane factor (OMF) lipoprotein